MSVPSLNTGHLAGKVLLEVRVPLPGSGEPHAFTFHLPADDARRLAALLEQEAASVERAR